MAPTDHGEFIIVTARNDDLKLLRASVDFAKRNQERPGHHWYRLVAKPNAPQGDLEIIKMYHVDLNAEIIEITEIHDGTETARRTLALDALG